jgi:uncharacterized protein
VTTKKRRRTSKPAKRTLADNAMPLDRLHLWLQERAKSTILPHPAATSIPMLDGFVTAIVAGPTSFNPPDWICPLLGVEFAAFTSENEETFAICAVALRHNEISNTLSTAPKTFEPMFARKPDGGVNVQPWCNGFYAAIQLRPLAWSPMLNPNSAEHRLLRPILIHSLDNAGRPVLDSKQGAADQSSPRGDPRYEIPPSIEAMRQFWMPIRYRR